MVCDQGDDVNLLSLDEIEGAQINRRPAVRFESSRRTHWCNEGGLAEHHVVHYAEIDSGMTMPVKQHSCLLSDQSRNESQNFSRARRFDQIINALPPGAFLHSFNRVVLARIDDLVSAKIESQFALVFVRFSGQHKAV